jgi:CheY-like chemotaxis protein
VERYDALSDRGVGNQYFESAKAVAPSAPQRGSYNLAAKAQCITLVPRTPKSLIDRVRSFEILIVMDNEAIAHAASATLRRAGHRVTASTTIAGTVETLMRRGEFVDVIITSTRLDSMLGYDAVQYGRKFAANARFIVLREVSGRVEDIELALARQSIPDRLQVAHGWN